jgi:enoyl-[acyl-carrier protein] reductase/trans-2-enoyl-CoA reductase (NAD+)
MSGKVIQPMIRNNICINAHPEGLKQDVLNQIAYVKEQGSFEGPKSVLVLGASTGYGLASRIAAAFGSGAKTLGVSYEKMPSEKRAGTPGFYNCRAFDEAARAEGLKADTILGDAFSDELKQEVVAKIKSGGYGKIDMVVYSLASGVRTDPKTGVTYYSALKPIGKPYHAKSIDFMTEKVSEVEIQPASDEDIEATRKVMGGEDWELWIQALKEADVLAEGVITLAYSYIGPKVTFPVYREGTIGRAKEHLEKTAGTLTSYLSDINGKAYVSVNKALVTRASSVIPVVPLYIALLFKIMKERGLHEGCIEQMYRMMNDKIYKSGVETDENNLIRLDDWEMSEEVQETVDALWDKATDGDHDSLGDIEGFREDFLKLHGFNVDGVDYEKPVESFL